MDAQEFVASVETCAPELHDTLGLLRNQPPDHILRETRERKRKKRQRLRLEAEGIDSEEDVLSDHPTLTEAHWVLTIGASKSEEDPDSPAGQPGMTKGMFDAFTTPPN
jgi:hypothetical protein